MNIIVGANSRLGRSLAASLPPHPILLDRAIYQDWWRNGADNKISYFFEKLKADGNHSHSQTPTVYVPAGVLDPSKPESEHYQINFLLAKNIIDAAGRLGFRTVTFGTVMELLIGSHTSNPYIASKIRLSDYIQHLKQQTALHIRLHTLYGIGLPSPFMFLGQILHALSLQVEFKMSPGNQLREYHHIDDVVQAIIHLLSLKQMGVVELNHGQALALKDLASHIFFSFGCLELLKIAALPEPPKENYQAFTRSSFLGDQQFRDTLPAIISYLQGIQACKNYL